MSEEETIMLVAIALAINSCEADRVAKHASVAREYVEEATRLVESVKDAQAPEVCT